jgi:LysM domain
MMPNGTLKIRMISSLIAAILLALPFQLAAEEKKETVEYESGFYYTVKKGDTLWGLSKKFSDNGWAWPEMWKDNNQIPNPHRIYPGERIRLFEKARIEEMVTVAPDKKEVAQETPVEEPPYFYYSLINRAGFLIEEPVSANGSIFKVHDDKVMISIGDMVYIRPREAAPLKPGDRYTVYRTMDPYKNPESKAIIGTQHYLSGVLEIKDVEADYATALIVKSYRTIEIGDQLMPYRPRSPKITLAARPGGVTGKILVAEEQEKLIGTNFVAFIDKGENDGIQPGQQYRVFETQSFKVGNDDKNKTSVTDIDFATILVLFTQPTTSTILVTNSKKNISPGAQFH